MPYGTFARLLACWHVKMRSWHAFGMLAHKPRWHTSTLAHRPRWHKGMHGMRFSKLICQSLFSVKLHTFSLKFFKLKTASWIFFSEFCKIFKNTFLQDSSYCFWYLEKLTFKLLILVTHNNILKICRIIQYSKNIF